MTLLLLQVEFIEIVCNIHLNFQPLSSLAVYGLSESSPLTHCDGGRPGKLGTIGQLVPSTVAKVMMVAMVYFFLI